MRGFGSFPFVVSEMEEEESLQLLRNSSELDPQQLESSELEDMRKIISKLGSFALAIQLTGSYVSQTPRIPWIGRASKSGGSALYRQIFQGIFRYAKSGGSNS